MERRNTPEFIVEPDAIGLYRLDGSVDFGAVEAFLSEQAPAKEASPLDDVANAPTGFDIVIDPDALVVGGHEADDPILWLGTPGSAEYAQKLYVTWLIGQQVHKARIRPNPEFVRNPNFQPDLRTEIKRMLHGRLPLGDPAAQLLSHSELDVHKLRGIVAVPNAALQETSNIYQTLTNYTKQAAEKLGSDEFEVVVHDNFGISEDDDHYQIRAQLDTTLAEIERFKHDHPRLTVRNFCTRYQKQSPQNVKDQQDDAPYISTVRADLFNAIGQDLYNRGRTKDIPVFSNDADTIETGPFYLSDMIETFEKTGADIIAGVIAWEMIDDLPEHSTANAMLRFQMFIDELRNRYEPEIKAWDANTGFSLATYFAAGGFKPGIKLGETFDLVWAIRDLRQGSGRQHEVLVPSAILTSNSRRLIEAMALGYMPYDAWNKDVTSFSHDDALRTAERRSLEAESNARLHAQEWTARMEQTFCTNIPERIAGRVLGLAKLALGLVEYPPHDQTKNAS